MKKFYITGDTHGNFSRFYHPEDWAGGDDSNAVVIILGDAGFNVDPKTDCHKKNKLCKKTKAYFYCVLGNHELRPADVKNMELIWDETVSGYVYYQPQWPQIRYFKEYGIYWIDGHRTLVIGGAYSVDKWYRLCMGWFWNSKEQLTRDEMDEAMRMALGESFDLVLTHTCPVSFQPTDLFLNMIDQSSVDNSMELWMEKLKDSCSWKVWLFGHYHSDRCEQPGVEMCYTDIQLLTDIWNRWAGDPPTWSLEWWLPKGPKFDYYVKDDNNDSGNIES